MMTRDEIRQFLGELNIGPWDGAVLFDRAYSLPDRDWFFGEFADKLRADIQALGFVYAESAGDCDDFAMLGRALAQLSHYFTPGRQKGTALAVGAFGYSIGGQTYDEDDPQAVISGHCIIGAICRTGPNERKLCFMEPQTGKEVYLTPKERQSCNVYIF